MALGSCEINYLALMLNFGISFYEIDNVLAQAIYVQAILGGRIANVIPQLEVPIFKALGSREHLISVRVPNIPKRSFPTLVQAR